MKQPIAIPQPLSIITITKRKCSDKVQPHIKCNTLFIVKSVEYLNNGTPVLVVADNRKKSELRINAERFEWKITDKADLQERAFKEQCSKETDELFKNFSFSEHIKIAFIPLVISQLAFVYGKKCREAAAQQKISILRPLTRAFDQLHKEYVKELSIDLDKGHLEQIEEQSERFMKTYAKDFQIFWLTVNSEFKRVCPTYPFANLRTDALCGAIMVDMLCEHNNNVDALIEHTLKRPTNTITNPMLMRLRHLLMGYAGDIDMFDFSRQNVVLAKKVMLKRINEIQFEVSK